MRGKKKIRWVIAYRLSRLYVRYGLGNRLTYDKDIRIDSSEPFVLLGNHSCFYDFLYAVNAIGPHPVRFVVASKYFSSPILGPILRYFDAIPKRLAERDMECMRSIISAIANGDNVAIYPEGRVSMWGVTESISPATAKLVKRFGCNLVLVQNLGGFFLCPPYGGGKRSGKTDTRVKVLDKATVKDATAAEINKEIQEMLYVNQYAWYENNDVTYKGTEKVNTLTNLIYRCPSCYEIGALGHSDNKLVCGNCGVVGEVRDCHVNWSNQDIPSTISEIYQLLQEYEREEMLDPNWCIDIDCDVEILDLSSGKMNTYTECKASLDIEHVSFSFDSETLTIKNSQIDYLPYDVGINFQIYRNGNLYNIKPYNKPMAVGYSIAHETAKRFGKDLVIAREAN